MKRAFTPEQDRQIAKEYASGVSSLALQVKYGVSRGAIYAALRRAGTPAVYTTAARRQHMLDLVAGRRVLTDEEEAAAIKAYRNGASTTSLASQYHTTTVTICRICERHGVRRRICTRRLPLDESAFDNAEASEAAAYWVGMLMADGCICTGANRSPAFKLSLAGDDGEHIYDLRSFLGSGHKVLTERSSIGQTRKSLNINSGRLVAALARYGVVPRKSLTARVLLLENNPHFWRGMVCGDGSVFVRYGHPVIVLAGSKENVDLFLSFCKTLTPTQATVHPIASIWETRLQGSHALAVIRALFECCCVALARKWNTARQVLAEYSPRKRGGRRN